jgi:hypothetical protein
MITISKEKGPTDAAEDDTYVPRYPNLDPQNTPVDDNNSGAGMIDWDNCFATPRCIGYSSLPEFFQRDWNKGFLSQTHLTC